MDLVNHTPYPAFLWTAIADDDRLMAALVTRVTFDIRDGRLTPSAEQVWRVSPAPWECPYGPVEADDVFYRGGVDLLVFGHARAPAGREVAQIEVSVELGSFRRRALVFGDRVWERKGDRLQPSQPRWFDQISLALANAFGGKAPWDGLEVPFADNPNGKGYYLEEEEALGQKLPNIEDPEHLIRNWNDYPDPVGFGFCPMANSKRLQRGIEFDDKVGFRRLHAHLFNVAFPDMVLASVKPGERCRVVGMSESSPVSFTIPDFQPRIRLTFDSEVIEKPLMIDQIGIEVDKNRVFISYRYPFLYVLYPLQRRLAELLPP